MPDDSALETFRAALYGCAMLCLGIYESVCTSEMPDTAIRERPNFLGSVSEHLGVQVHGFGSFSPCSQRVFLSGEPLENHA